MDKLSKKNDEFFCLLYKKHFKAICNYVRRLYPQTTSYEDIAQETFYEALQHIEILKSHPNALGWLFVTAKNITYQTISKDKRHSEILPDLITDVPADEINNMLLMESLKIYLQETDVDMLLRYYADNYTAKDIANMYQKSPGSVKKKIYRLRDYAKSLAHKIFTLPL